jgi:hypothetical protein
MSCAAEVVAIKNFKVAGAAAKFITATTVTSRTISMIPVLETAAIPAAEPLLVRQAAQDVPAVTWKVFNSLKTLGHKTFKRSRECCRADRLPKHRRKCSRHGLIDRSLKHRINNRINHTNSRLSNRVPDLCRRNDNLTINSFASAAGAFRLR